MLLEAMLRICSVPKTAAKKSYDFQGVIGLINTGRLPSTLVPHRLVMCYALYVLKVEEAEGRKSKKGRVTNTRVPQSRSETREILEKTRNFEVSYRK